MRKHHTIKINLPGGIISAGDLYALMAAAEKVKLQQVQLGNRQQLYCKVTPEQLNAFREELDQLGLFYETDVFNYPNILSSYVAEDVFPTSHWLSESVYKDILSSFDFRSRLKISLVDAQQTFTPFYSGNLNFISSTVNNYWHLYIRFPKTPVIYYWKGLIYSGDIIRICRLLEEIIFSNKELFYEQPVVNGELLYTMAQSREHFLMQPPGEGLKIPAFTLPYYEGFNRYGDKSWLGIYRRDEYFPVAFLKELALICLQTKVGQLYTTAWKSLIIKGIQQNDRRQWDYVLGKYRINVRHAANELNWQVEDLDEEALNLKRYLIRQFDKDDVRTFGLCFAIKTKPHSNVFGAIVIRRQNKEAKNKLRALDRYDILYSNDFNPNNKEYILFRKAVEKENLGTYLVSLCKYFYELQSEDSSIMHTIYRQEEAVKQQAAVAVINTPSIYQCSHCLSLYDPQYGDEQNGIITGTVFEELPGSYQCPVCEASKGEFQLVTEKELFI